MIKPRHNTGFQHPGDVVQAVEIHENAIKSVLYIDSNDRVGGGYSNARYEGGNILQQNVQKIGVKEYYIDYRIPNVNGYNNYISFYSAVDNNYYEVELDVGLYTPALLMDMIVTKLNSSPSAVIFSHILRPDKMTLFNGSSPFRFLNTADIQSLGLNLRSNHIDRARPLTGLYRSDAVLDEMVISVRGMYTNTIDVICRELRDGQIIGNMFCVDNSFSDSAHVIRIILNPPIETINGDGSQVFSDEIRNIHYNLIRQKRLNTLTVDLYDEFGLPLYQTSDMNGETIDYFRYNIEMSIVV